MISIATFRKESKELELSRFKIDEVIRNAFINSITDEIKIRIQKKISNDAKEYLKSLTHARVKFFEKILKIDLKSKSWIKWIFIGAGVAATVGIIGRSFPKSSGNKKENKTNKI